MIFFLLKILVIGLKPSLKVWMTFPYGRVSKLLYLFSKKTMSGGWGKQNLSGEFCEIVIKPGR